MASTSTTNQQQSHRQAYEKLVQICSEYGDLHRHFLQLLMQNSFIEVSKIPNVIVGICKGTDDELKQSLKGLKNLSKEENTRLVNAFYETTNVELNPLGMYITHEQEDEPETDNWVLSSYGNLRGVAAAEEGGTVASG